MASSFDQFYVDMKSKIKCSSQRHRIFVSNLFKVNFDLLKYCTLHYYILYHPLFIIINYMCLCLISTESAKPVC